MGSRECTYFLIGGVEPCLHRAIGAFSALRGRAGRTRSRRRRRPGSPPRRRWRPAPSSSGALSGPLCPYAAEKVVAAGGERDPIPLPGKLSCSLPGLERVGDRLRLHARLLGRARPARARAVRGRPGRPEPSIALGRDLRADEARAGRRQRRRRSRSRPCPRGSARQQTTSRPPASSGSASASARAPSGLWAASKIDGGIAGTNLAPVPGSRSRVRAVDELRSAQSKQARPGPGLLAACGKREVPVPG